MDDLSSVAKPLVGRRQPGFAGQVTAVRRGGPCERPRAKGPIRRCGDHRVLPRFGPLESDEALIVLLPDAAFITSTVPFVVPIAVFSESAFLSHGGTLGADILVGTDYATATWSCASASAASCSARAR